MKKLLRYCGLVALAGAALYLPNCDDDGGLGPEPKPYDGVWEWVPTPKCESSVSDIYFVSPSDGWAVAGWGHIWHYDGSRWKYVTKLTPENPLYDYGITEVWFNGPNDGWFGGYELRPGKYRRGEWHSKMWHYDGAGFKEVEIPDVRFIYKIHFNAPDDGWAFGGDYALRYDGERWYMTEFPSLYWTGCFFWNANDGWANSHYSIYRWDGVTWTPVIYVGGYTRLHSIGFAKPTKGWAVGEEAPMSGFGVNAWRWNGVRWEETPAFELPDRTTLLMNDIQFLSSDYGWAAGEGTFHWDGKGWKRYDMPYSGKDGKGFFCYCIFCLSENDVWAGGTRGNIIHFKGFGGK